jgi:hypothetical protein
VNGRKLRMVISETPEKDMLGGGGGLKARQEAQEEETKADEAEEESGDELNREYGRAWPGLKKHR